MLKYLKQQRIQINISESNVEQSMGQDENHIWMSLYLRRLRLICYGFR